ncbi:hypothetical protein IU459_22325 [Nocardia amamiensis]|uniref:Tox-PL domain-containing protein n=1 Tax=Nocardia amamiensis TaxID=404578 RepID=A0ABS0CVT3_9NOCA|nr:toxin glutamine deamidase domain-containing protein [Nocardia amamiensis]MBF6300260.1 hypothetical protein [Nocardia amamiensis]
MGIEIPGWLQWAAQWLVGAGDWPEGDETAMRRVADAWSGMSAALNELDDDAAHTMQLALAAIDGKTHDAMAAHWDKLAGKEGAWQALVKYIDKLADQIGDGAADIEHTKLVIIGAMVIFAIEVAPLLATAWTGFGSAGVVVLRVATQVTIRMAIKQLIARMLTRAAAKAAARVALLGAINEALEEGGLEIGAKIFQLADERRDEVSLRDWKDAGIAALAGAAGGAVGGGLGRSGLLSGVDDVATSRLGRAGIAATTETATGIAGETAAAATVAALTDQPFQLTLESITSSAAQGVPHGLHSAAGTRPTDTDPETTPPDIDDPGPTPPVPSDSQPERTQPTQSDTDEQTQPSSTQPEPEAIQPASAHADGTESDSPTSNPVENTTPAPTDSAQAQNTTAHTSEVGTENSSLTLPSPDSADPVSGNPQTQTQAATPVSAEATPTPSHADSPSDSTSSLASSDPGPPTLSSNQATSLNDTAPTVSAEQDPTGTATTSPTPTAPSHIPSEIGEQPTDPSNPAPAAYDSVADRSGSQPSNQNQPSVGNPPPIVDQAAPAPGQRVAAATAPDTATPSTTSPLAAAPPSTHTPRPDAQANSPTDTVTSSAVTTASPAAVPPSTLAGTFAHTTDASQRPSLPTPDPATAVGPSQSAPVATPRSDQTTRPTVPPQSVSPVVSPPTATSGPSSTSAPPAGLVHRASPPDRASSVGTASPAPISDPVATTRPSRREETPDTAQPSRPIDPTTRRQSDTDHPGPPSPESMSHSGGAVRPRDDFAAFDWAEDAYDHFRRDDRDIDHIARTLEEHPRADGSHFTRDDVEQIKNHLFREEQPIIDYDGNLIHRRFDADPDIAEAWIRLRAGHPLRADIVLLEHELAESDYLRAHPESTYQDAHAHANLDHHWSKDTPPRTGERYDTLWGRHDGTADLLQPDQGQPERSGVPVRGDEGQPRPHTDHRQDEQHRPHGPTGGRDLPSDRRTDHGPGQTREAVAPERRDRLVTDHSDPRETHTHPDTSRPRESDRGPAPHAEQRTENPSTTATPPHVGDRNQPTRHPAPDRAVGETAADNRPQSPSRPPDPGAFFRRRRRSGADTPRRGDSWDQAMRELAASSAPQPESAARRGTLPVQDRPYYANPDFRDRDAADEYARNHPNYLHEVAGIRARAVHAHPEVARLTDAEIAAIRHNQFLSLNEHVNRATRDGDTRALEEYDAAVRALVGAYNALPDHHGVVYRSLYIADPVLLQRFLDEYQVGNTPADRGFASSDKESSMPGGNIELIIESRHGKDISWASGQQDEVVFPPGHRFRVDNRTFENGKHIIYLTDLGRNPDGHQSRGNGTDSTRSPRSYAEAGELGSRDSGTGGTQHGRLAREGSEGPTPSHRGADQDLASLGRIGTEADRSGTRRDDGVSRQAEQTRPDTSAEHRSQHPTNRSADPRLPSTPPHAESAPPMWAHQDPNYIANSHRLPDWWPRAEHSGRPHAPETRAPVADLSSMRAPESLPPPPHLAPPPTHGAEPRPLTAPPQPRPTHITPAPHDQGRPGPHQRQEPEHTTGNREPRRRPDPRFEPNTGSEPRRQNPHNPAPPHDPHSSARQTELPDQRRPVDPETQRALETRNARENYRRRAPEDNRVIAVRPDRTTGIPAYEVRRYAEGPEHVAVVSVRVHLEAGAHISPQEMRNLIENAHLATDRAFNYGRRLLNRDWLMVDVVFTNDPSTAHLSVNVDHGTGGPRTWHPHDTPDVLANHLREHLGLPVDSQNQPTVRPEDIRQISNDIAAANTPTRFTRLPETRVIGHNRLDALEDQAYQAMVEDSLRDGDRFTRGADPRTHPYGRLVNDGGPRVQGRRNNCLDCALSALASFFGSPQVSLPRWRDLLSDGTVDERTGEQHGLERAARWLGNDLSSYAGHGLSLPDQFAAVHDWIAHLGPGSAALIVNEWHARDSNGNLLYDSNGDPITDGTHATVVVYPPGASGPVWWDPQSGETSDGPPTRMVNDSTQLWFTPIPPDQGVNNAGVSNRGPSGSVPGRDIQFRTGIPDSSVRERVGLRPDPDTGGNRRGTGPRLDEIGDRFRDRGGDRVPELVGTDGDGRLYGGEADRTAADGRPGVPATVDGEYRTDTGRPDRSGVLDTSVVDDGGTQHRTPSDHRQADPALPDEHVRDPSHVRTSESVGIREQEPGRDLAATRDVRVLGPLNTTPHDVLAPLPAQAADIVPSGRDNSGDPDRTGGDDRGRSNEPDHRWQPDAHSPSEAPTSRNNEPTPPGMYRGEDGLLHKPGDRADSYRDPDGKWHRIGDREGTYRDKNFQLREGKSWVTDPAVREDIAFLADKGPAERYEVVDPDIRAKLADLAAEANRQDSERAAASAAVKAHMREFGVNKIDELSEKKLPALIDQQENRIANDPSLSDQDKLAKLERLYEMADSASNYNRLGTEMVSTTKEMGELGGIAHATDRPDTVLLTPFEGAIDGRDTFDVIAFADRPHPTLILEECKGGSSTLGAADTEKGRAEQGSREYGERTAAIEKNLERLLVETPEQMRARGVDPDSHKGQQLLKARDELLRAHADGTLRVEYNLVHVSRDGVVTVSQFNLERDGQSFSLEIIGGIDRARAHELVRAVEARELEQVMARAMEEHRARLLQSLDPRERELVLEAVQFSREMVVSERTPDELRAKVLEYVEKFREKLERDAGRASMELAEAKQLLDRLQSLELDRSLDILENISMDPELKEVAKDLLTANVVDRDRAIVAELEIATRELVASVTEQVLQTRDPQLQDRGRSLDQALDKVRQLEVGREQGLGPDLANLLEAHNSIEHVQRIERENDARTVQAIGLSPEHEQEVFRALEVEREQAVAHVRDAVAREVVQQHNLIVEQNPALRIPESRGASFDARAYLLRLEHEPSSFNREKMAFVYELPGREPVLVPYDSQAARLAATARAIQRGLSIEHAAVVHLAREGQAIPAQEVVRTPPTAEELRMRGRSAALARERERERERER